MAVAELAEIGQPAAIFILCLFYLYLSLLYTSIQFLLPGHLLPESLHIDQVIEGHRVLKLAIPMEVAVVVVAAVYYCFLVEELSPAVKHIGSVLALVQPAVFQLQSAVSAFRWDLLDNCW